MSRYTSAELANHGIELPVPEAVDVARTVDLARISRQGVVLHSGTRLEGARTALATGARVGTLGPARLFDVALGAGAEVASGSLESATLLRGAVAGPNSHIRAGTLMEEESSTGHAVGLKQSILLSFATLGSQINFCDCLLAGGRDRADHSEVGSGFIHFNFTPFGTRGDKATASLFGDVPRGVTLDSNRIFLGGSGGVVGPVVVGFGTVLAAGSVYRRDYDADRLVYSERLEPRVLSFDPFLVRSVERKLRRSIAYVRQLQALAAWYADVRLARETDSLERTVLESALERLDEGVAERLKQVDRLLESSRAKPERVESWARERAELLAKPRGGENVSSRDRFLTRLEGEGDHVTWVRGLDVTARQDAAAWLDSIALTP